MASASFCTASTALSFGSILRRTNVLIRSVSLGYMCSFVNRFWELKMKLLLSITLGFLALFFGMTIVHAQQDITPPMLLDVRFDPVQIDTSKGPATITVTVHVTDDLSGVDEVELFFRKSGTTQTAEVRLRHIIWDGQPNDPLLDGTLTSKMRLPQYAAFGEWEMFNVILEDKVGNDISYTKPEDTGEDLQGDEWPSLYNGFAFAVGEVQQPARIFMPSLSVQ